MQFETQNLVENQKVVNATVNPQKEGAEANNFSEKKHEAAEYVAS